MSIVPESDQTPQVDQAAVNGNENHHAEPVDDGRLDDWGEEPQQGAAEPQPEGGPAEPEGGPAEPEGAVVASRWQNIGARAAELYLKGSFILDREPVSGDNQYWELRDERCWGLVGNDRGPLAELFLREQYELAAALGDAKSAKKVRSSGFAPQLTGKLTPFWAGANVVLRKKVVDPPDHMILTPGGVLDLLTGEMVPVRETPFLFTACLNGRYIPKDLVEMQILVESRIKPAVPSERDRSHLQKCFTLAMGGKAGALDQGSLLYMVGKPGGGKGNLLRYAEDAFGGYCMPVDVAALTSRGDLNSALASVLEANPRLLTMSEVTRFQMAKSLAITGRDTLSARTLYKPHVRRRLSCAIAVSSAAVPQARTDTGMERRLFVIQFDKVASVNRANARDTTTQDERDALVTVCLHDALTMWQKPLEWEGLPADDPATRAVLLRADPVAELVSGLTEEHEGTTIGALVRELRDQGHNPKSGRVRETLVASGRWKVERRRWHKEPGAYRIFWSGG